MDVVLILTVLILLYTFQTLFCVYFNMNYEGEKRIANAVFIIAEAVTIAVVSFIRVDFQYPKEPITLVLGMLSGCALLGYNLSLMKGTPLGSYAFISISMLMGGLMGPIITSAIFFGESLSILQIVAIVVMLLSMVLYNGDGILEKQHYPLKFYIFCALLFLCNASYNTIAKAQVLYCEAESVQMVGLTNVFMGCIGVGLLLKETKSFKGAVEAFHMSRKALMMLVLCLASATTAVLLAMKALTMMDTVIMYTVEHGGIIVLSALSSFVLFKEKVTKLKIAGIICAMISIVLLIL